MYYIKTFDVFFPEKKPKTWFINTESISNISMGIWLCERRETTYKAQGSLGAGYHYPSKTDMLQITVVNWASIFNFILQFFFLNTIFPVAFKTIYH